MAGWLKLYRKLLNWEWYHDNNVKVLFLHLLLTAKYEQTQWKGITVRRGQLLTTMKALSYELGLSVKQLRTAIRKLSSSGDVSIETHSRYSIITVTNFESYQGDDMENEAMDVDDAAFQPTVRTKTVTFNTDKERQYQSQMEQDKYWQEVVCMRYHLTPQQFQQELTTFWMDAATRVKPHRDIVDAKNHFCNWYQNRQRIIENDKQRNNEYNNNRQQQLSQRRGFEATASQAQDYEGTF